MELFSADSEADFRLHVLHKKGIVIVDFGLPGRNQAKRYARKSRRLSRHSRIPYVLSESM